jgi:hypothetical protein
MAKKAFVYDGTQWVDIAQSTTDLSAYQTVNRTGLNLVVPTSVTGGTLSTNGKITFTASSGVSVNGCFTSAYENYIVLINAPVKSVANNIPIKFRSTGTDDSSNNYDVSFMSNSGTAISVTTQTSTSASINWGSATRHSAKIEIYSPALAEFTTYVATTSEFTPGTLIRTTQISGLHKVASAFDGFTMTPSTGTATGTIRIYGYNNGA